MIIRLQTRSSRPVKVSFYPDGRSAHALVTGANGFSGRHLVRLLESERVQVSVLRLRGSDLTDGKRITEALEKTQPDYIFHLAGVASADSAEEFFRVNVLYATVLLRATCDAKINDRPILIVGTSAEYGRVVAEDLPLKETLKCRPYNYYGMSKFMQTLVALNAVAHDNPRIVIARPFNIIGPAMPKHLAVASFARQLAEIKAGNRPPTMAVGNLNSCRDFIDVEDVVRLYWTLSRTESAYGEIFNLCTGVATPIGALLNLLIEVSGTPVRIELAPHLHKEVDIPVHYGCNEKIGGAVGGFSYTPLEQTIQKIVR